MRERHVCELARRVREDADSHACGLQAAELRARLGARSEVDRRAVVGEPPEQRPPLAELLVEDPRSSGAVLGQVEVHARPAAGVLEPVAPQRSCISEHRVEIESDRVHNGDARLALRTGER